ncbi:serine aminopeptidase domain-containing protein [Candidatus Chloroploca sp. Khr17]|uniref:alpha/beta fold hydrolase n=1 Tax=Candidatus Chloroploca sp. Khr17 TaxID=2496869 RepID=UPI00101CCBA3|nr:alpha/beta hydrolase [Candidatus Chloroploca sp. Khr17]
MTSMPTHEPIEPAFFGPPSHRLFGCYHEPQGWPVRDYGIVICYPIGQEYLRSHRACQYLASAAARAGFPTLRFDYYGTGDSAGDPDELALEHWRNDLLLAVEELRARSGVGPVILAGLRLGASLALTAAAQIDDLAGLVLWEPVVHGNAYLDELVALHDEAILRYFVRPQDYTPSPRPAELLGFPVGAPLRTALEKLDLLAVPPPRARPILLIESHSMPEHAALANHLGARARLTHEHVPSFTVWTDDVDKGLVPNQVIAAIVAWLEKVFA